VEQLGVEIQRIEIASSVRAYRAQEHLAPVSEGRSVGRHPLHGEAGIPWRRLLGLEQQVCAPVKSIPQRRVVAAVPTVQTILECLPSCIIEVLQAQYHAVPLCDQCSHMVQQPQLSSVLHDFMSASEPVVVALTVSTAVLASRDGLDWRAACEFYQAARVIENSILVKPLEATNPQYLVIDTISVSAQDAQPDLYQRAEQRLRELLIQHGELCLINFKTDEKHHKVVHHQCVVASPYYCASCHRFLVLGSLRSQLQQLSLAEITPFLVAKEPQQMSHIQQCWLACLSDRTVQKLFVEDKDFPRIIKALATFVATEDEKAGMPVFLEIAKRSWLTCAHHLEVILKAAVPTVHTYVPTAHPPIKMHPVDALPETATYNFYTSSAAMPTIEACGALSALLAKRFAVTPEARRTGMTAKKIQSCIATGEFPDAVDSSSIAYLSVPLPLLAELTIEQLLIRFETDTILHNGLKLLTCLGFGSCLLQESPRGLLEAEKQRLWLSTKLLAAQRRRQSSCFVVEDIDSDIGEGDWHGLHQILQQLCKNNHVIFKASYEAGNKKFIQYA
jgi:hypothetical protein